MTTVDGPGLLPLDVAAELTARRLLRFDAQRLAHTSAVAVRAGVLTATVSREQAPLLVAAAWLHDIGYHTGAGESGFHPLDGARYLCRTGWPTALCSLVAHHSGSRFVASACELDDELSSFVFTEDRLSDALSAADQSAGPDGRSMTVQARMLDMLRRHGSSSPSARAHPARAAYLLAATRRVIGRLEQAGVPWAPLRLLEPAPLQRSSSGAT